MFAIQQISKAKEQDLTKVQLAIATDSYHIYFFKYDIDLNKFVEIKKEDDTLLFVTTNTKILNMEWFEDIIYIGTKNNYRWINYLSGE